MLRTAAGELLSTDDIAGQVIVVKGFDADDAILRAAIREQVGSTVKRLHREGAIENVGAGRREQVGVNCRFQVENRFFLLIYALDNSYLIRFRADACCVLAGWHAILPILENGRRFQLSSDICRDWGIGGQPVMLDLQREQFEHDERFHREIARLDLGTRLKHMALHFL